MRTLADYESEQEERGKLFGIEWTPAELEPCRCGHRRGHHNSQRCVVGTRGFNARHDLAEPECFCHGFSPATQPTVAQDGAFCTSCYEYVEPVEIYDCSCGYEFTSAESDGDRRCPECGRFAELIRQNACPQCLWAIKGRG